MIISLSGSIVSESYDYLMIYEGTTADPNALIGTYYNCAIPTIYSQSGPLTIYFKSDYSGNYAGYELNVQCVEAPSCYRLTELNKASLSNNSITILSCRWPCRRSMYSTCNTINSKTCRYKSRNEKKCNNTKQKNI